VARDRVGGHDCLLTSVQFGAPGYSVADLDAAAAFGILTASNSYAGELDKLGNGIPNLNFAQPSGSNADVMNSAWRT
jgi:hypothetical protein